MVDKSSFLQGVIHFTLVTAVRATAEQFLFINADLIVSLLGEQCVGRPDINGLPNFQFEPRFRLHRGLSPQ